MSVTESPLLTWCLPYTVSGSQKQPGESAVLQTEKLELREGKRPPPITDLEFYK